MMGHMYFFFDPGTLIIRIHAKAYPEALKPFFGFFLGKGILDHNISVFHEVINIFL